MSAPHIVVLGGGYVGMYAAYGLQKTLGRRKARITVIDPRSYMTYQRSYRKRRPGPSNRGTWLSHCARS